jgi:hypothetical protein
MRAASSAVVRKGESVVVVSLMGGASVRFELFDRALEGPCNPVHDFGLRGAQSSFDPGQVSGGDASGSREIAQPVATQLALPPDSGSVDLHAVTIRINT